jgi:hypothetical protein
MLDVLPLPEVDPDALRPPPEPPVRGPRISRRWRRFGGGVLLVASVSSLVWWRSAVTADPGLDFSGGANVFRSAPGDVTGITRVENALGTDVRIEFEPGGTFMAFFGLVNRGPRSVRIEEVRPQGFYYWAFDGMAVARGEQDVFPSTDHRTFRPFTLAAGETRYLRLDFRLADCDPAGLQHGGYSVVDSLPVTYKVLGFRRTVDVPFDKTALSVLAMGECNHPLLPRH